MIRTELVTQIGRAARRLGARPRGLLFTPVARGNPFQELLYGELWHHDVAPLPVYEHGDLAMATLFHELGGAAAVHLHWTTEITGRADSEVDASDAAKVFLDRVRSLQDRGVKFVWTIHNRLPHECRFVDVELDFRAELAATADAVHVMAATAVEELTELYPLPQDRIVVVAHPAYHAAYPQYVQQPDARLRLGIDQDRLVIAVPGAIRPYKHIDLLHAALRAAGSPAHLLVAGEPGPDTGELIEGLRADAHVSVITRRLSDREMSELIIAADLVSSIYGSPISSGAAALALTLGRAVLAPDRRSAREQYGDAAIYSTTDPERLARTLAGLDRSDLHQRGQAARQIAAERRSAPTAFARAITDLLGAKQA